MEKRATVRGKVGVPVVPDLTVEAVVPVGPAVPNRAHPARQELQQHRPISELVVEEAEAVQTTPEWVAVAGQVPPA